MSDFGGLGGALLISQQLEAYRWEDHFRRARADNALAANDAGWLNQYNDLVNRYNRLLHDANRLADVQDKSLDAKDRQIDELKATSAKLEAQTERLTVELADSRARVKLLRGLIRELRPETYRSVYEDE